VRRLSMAQNRLIVIREPFDWPTMPIPRAVVIRGHQNDGSGCESPKRPCRGHAIIAIVGRGSSTAPHRPQFLPGDVTVLPSPGCSFVPLNPKAARISESVRRGR